MIKKMCFSEIKKYKQKGFTISQVARRLDLSYPTVKKYWDLDDEEFSKISKEVHKKNKGSKIAKYTNEILGLLKEAPDMASSQIHDRLEEKYGELIDFSERTTRNKVRELREEYDIEKPPASRDYQKVIETEPGFQAQVDFGEGWMALASNPKKRKKLYLFTMSLSYSRYKFAYWQDHPFKVKDVIECHQKAFEYFGGIPQEIVYDQDTTMVIFENYGEIIFTEEFQNYLRTQPFTTHVCRGADPESKGKIEAVVKYTKNNFARNRKLENMEKWNEACLSWLDRRANGKVHGTTKEIPAVRFSKEQPLLQPIKNYYHSDPIITYSLRKDNTLEFKSNYYDVPKGTYRKCRQVQILIRDDELHILNPKTGEIIQIHDICEGKGQHIALSRPDKHQLSKPAQKLKQEVLELYHGITDIRPIVKNICRELPRYAIDQFKVLIKVFEKWESHSELLDMAAQKCIELDLCTAVSYENCVEKLAGKEGIDKENIYYQYYHKKNEQEQKRIEEKLQQDELITKAQKIEYSIFDQFRAKKVENSSLQD